MKDKKLQTKRQTKTGFRQLHARVTSSRRKQRVSASASADMLDSEVPNASIGRALTVILVLHLVAIGAIYLGIQWNKSRVDVAVVPTETKSEAAVDLSNLNAGNNRAFVLAGDTYDAFAARHQVDVTELRDINGNATIHAGKALVLPSKLVRTKQPLAVAEVPVSDRPPLPSTTNVVQINNTQPAIVKAQSAVSTPKALIVKPSIPKAQPVVVAGSATYLVQPGDSVWRISHKYKVSQDALMQLNGMSNPRDLRSGMILKIPAN